MSCNRAAGHYTDLYWNYHRHCWPYFSGFGAFPGPLCTPRPGTVTKLPDLICVFPTLSFRGLKRVDFHVVNLVVQIYLECASKLEF